MSVHTLTKALKLLQDFAEDELVTMERPNLRYAVLDAGITLEREIKRLEEENRQLEKELGLFRNTSLRMNHKEPAFIKCPNCKEDIFTATEVESSTTGCCCHLPRDAKVIHSCPECGEFIGSWKHSRATGLFIK